MRTGIDSEWWLGRPGLRTPRLVCVQVSHEGRPATIYHRDDPEARRQVNRALDEDELIVGHNFASDSAVMARQWPEVLPRLFVAHCESRVGDTMLKAQCASIAADTYQDEPRKGDNRFSLEHLSHACLGTPPWKSPWRGSYWRLDAVPVAWWPRAAKDYAAPDAEVLVPLWDAIPASSDQFNQARFALVMELMCARGFRTNAQRVAAVKARDQAKYVDACREMRGLGFLRDDQKVDQVRLREVIQGTLGSETRMTPRSKDHPEGQVSTDEFALVLCNPHKPGTVEHSAHWTERVLNHRAIKGALSNIIPTLEQGVDRPVTPGHRLLASGRETCFDPQAQAMPRSNSEREGYRECVEPREGYDLAECDLSQAELVYVAQVCIDLFGFSRLAEIINAGMDPHSLVAAAILARAGYDTDYARFLAAVKAKDPWHKEQRVGNGKVPNFGTWGGMGPPSLMEYALGMGARLTLEEAKLARDVMRETYPEQKMYLDHMSKTEVWIHKGSGAVSSFTGFRKYTRAANRPFQRGVADVVKAAAFQVSLRCYCDPTSVLFASYPIYYGHDALMLEVPKGRGKEVGPELERLMVRELQRHCPNVKCAAEWHVFSKGWGLN